MAVLQGRNYALPLSVNCELIGKATVSTGHPDLVPLGTIVISGYPVALSNYQGLAMTLSTR